MPSLQASKAEIAAAFQIRHRDKTEVMHPLPDGDDFYFACGCAAIEAASFSASAGVIVKPGAMERVARSARNQRPHSTYGPSSGSAASVRRTSSIFASAAVATTN